jgi:CheY-like chemotaxis protein
VRAGDILDQAVALATPLFVNKGHTLEIDRAAADMAVYGDEVRLTQVLSNLLTNAARYTDAGGHIRVSCAADGDDIRFSVKDNGRGMSAELLPRVFEFFVQARAGGGGLGIGLALVKQIVEMHHGRVEARSEGEGRGSELSVWLPPSPREVPGAVRVDPVLPESKTRRALSIELIASTRPDVAFVDIGLPDLDGYELGRQICNVLGAQKPMLVALSGFAQDKDRERALLAGFDHHLNKPASPGDLERVLRNAEGAPASEARADRAGGAESQAHRS